jgi:murein DD-endopeptidase MepM/ murein hydrolase activator NlpD
MASDAFSRGFWPPRAMVRRLLLALLVPVGGCSADVTRFDFPAFGIADNGSSRPTGALPTPPEPVWPRTQAYNPTFSEGPTAAPRGAGLSDAPPPVGEVTDARGGFEHVAQRQDDGQGARDRYALADRPPQRRAEEPRASTADTVEVQPGDTLYAIARRYNVPVGALLERNHLGDGATLKPGQRLALPTGGATAVAAHERAPPAPAAPTEAPPGWDGQHTLQVGESLYGVARQYRVELAELQRVNGIAESAKVRAGTVLRVPHSSEPAARDASETAQAAPGEAPVQARVINQPEEVRTAALGNRANDASPPPATPAASEAEKFRWPVRGRVIVAFGARADGTRNDGINIAVPLGTEIHAAEAGRVAYAGSELKGYGNLVLIRHEGGWVSAYAHADQILVKRDDVVRRGQVIARAGKTGSVDQPQLHFELRQGAKPVDPLPHMEP